MITARRKESRARSSCVTGGGVYSGGSGHDAGQMKLRRYERKEDRDMASRVEDPKHESKWEMGMVNNDVPLY